MFFFQRRKSTAAISRKERTQKCKFVNDFKDRFSFLNITALVTSVVKLKTACHARSTGGNSIILSSN